MAKLVNYIVLRRSNVSFTWEKIIENFLSGKGGRKYPATWGGLFRLLDAAQCSDVTEELKNAVRSELAPFLQN